jgi:hypothetical protein
MKTNPIARRLVRVRVVLLGVALAASLGVEFFFGASAVARISQTTGVQTDGPAVPPMHFWDCLATTR